MQIMSGVGIVLLWIMLSQSAWSQTSPPTQQPGLEAGARLVKTLLDEIETMDLPTIRSRVVIGTPAEAQYELRELVILGARRATDVVLKLVAAQGEKLAADPAEWQKRVNEVTDAVVDYEAVVRELVAQGIREEVAKTRDRTELKVVLAKAAAAGLRASTDGLARAFREHEARARLAGDEGTAAALRSMVAMYYARNNGQFPRTREEIRRLYEADTGRPLEFACPGNDFTYDAATGDIELVIRQSERC